MTRNELNDIYFNWMYELVSSDTRYAKKLSYRKLLYLLHSMEFTYTIDMDGNRYEDGIDLRYRFGYENNLPDAMIADYLDDKPCSILEMLIALSIRLEEQIMDDPAIGDRTGEWFWNMIVNLGLHSMDDERFNRACAVDILTKFLNRDYERNGKGGLFTVHHCREDLRNVEIWYQACWYLDEMV